MPTAAASPVTAAPVTTAPVTTAPATVTPSIASPAASPTIASPVAAAALVEIEAQIQRDGRGAIDWGAVIGIGIICAIRRCVDASPDA
jgi:hypothetical protein